MEASSEEDNMSESDREALEKYLKLIFNFVQGNITADEFEASYLSFFKYETHKFGDEDFEVLDRLFGDVDAYCPDPQLRDQDDLDEKALLESAKRALAELDRQM